MKSAREEQQPKAGTVLEGKYLLERELGVGGMGQVFLARDTIIERKVAIKLLHNNLAGDEAVRRRFTTEAKAIARLKHPNCVMLWEFGISNELDALYAVFEFVDGQSLEKWVGQQIPIGDVLELGRQVADGMEHAHSQKIIHRDLKPDNIMVVVNEDGDLEFKILDFGIARITEDDQGDENERLTKMGQLFGTPPYMSPEQIKAKLNVTSASDIYSIGVILYELIEGRLPFLADTPIETVMLHLNEEVPPMVRQGVPRELQAIVMRCLEKRPEDRFGSCKDLGKALEGVPWRGDKRDSLLNFQAGQLEVEAEADEIGTLKTEVAFGGGPSESGVAAADDFEGEATIVESPPMLGDEESEEVVAPRAPITEEVRREEAVPAARVERFSTAETQDEGRIETLLPPGAKKKKFVVLLLILFLTGAVIITLAFMYSGQEVDEPPGEGSVAQVVDEPEVGEAPEVEATLEEVARPQMEVEAPAEESPEEELVNTEPGDEVAGADEGLEEEREVEERSVDPVVEEAPRRSRNTDTVRRERVETTPPPEDTAAEERAETPQAPSGISIRRDLRRDREENTEEEEENRPEPASIRLRRD